MEKYKILIVDDTTIGRLVLAELMKQLGCRYTEAENGRIAVQLYEKQTFDLIFMDIEMPVMNGFETTRYIRDNFPKNKRNIPIIAVTSHDPMLFFQEYQNSSFNDLIAKPFNIEKIKRKILQFCD